jgi:PGF-CTERM protein
MATITAAAAWLALAGAASAANFAVEITGTNIVFTPATLTLQVNDTVTWYNNGSMAHDVTFEDGSGTGAGALAIGANYSKTFTSAGAFKYRCTLHSGNFDTGMVGAITVQGASPPPPPAKSPGFEFLGALAALGAVAFVAARRRAA